jgi:DNA-binding CsgD family transcriptional regulator
MLRPGGPDVDQTALGPGEIRTLRHLAAGHSIAETAQLMQITKDSVRSHIRRIYTKYGVSTRQDAIRSGRLRGVITDACPTCGRGGTR